MSALAEDNPQSWRAEDDELYDGVMQGLRTASHRLSMLADFSERRVRVYLYLVRRLMAELVYHTGSYIGFSKFRGIENTEGPLHCHPRFVLSTGSPIW